MKESCSVVEMANRQPVSTGLHSIRKALIYLTNIFLVVSLASCALTNVPARPGTLTGKLVVTGSSTCAPLVAEIAKRFEAKHPGVRIDVQTGGSSRGIQDALKGIADIGMSSRSLKPSEAETLSSFRIAWDGVAFIVHAENPVDELTRSQLSEIYQGKFSNWSELGGPAAPIVAASRAEGRSELDLMSNYLHLNVQEMAADVIDGETQQSIKSIATNRNAIGFTSIGAAQIAINYGEPIKLLPLEGIEASDSTVQSGIFPVARPLVLLTKKNELRMSDLQTRFIQFATSEAVADLVAGLGYVPPLVDSVAEPSP